MANFETSSKFTDQVRKFETTDPAHADLFNSVIGALLNNDVFLKRVSEQLIEKIEQHATDKENPHGIDKDQLGLGKVNNTSDKEKPVSTAQQGAIDAAYQQSTGYTDQKIADLINGAPSTLDTLGEIARAMQDNANVVDALEAAIGTKASQAELDGHAGNSTIHITSTERTNWNDANNKKHSHSNKSVLDAISSTVVNNWNSAVTHISDAIKHITAAERKKWNNGSANYGTCSTAAATAAKTVACDGFELDTGAEITVKFTVTNTAASPTLNVNSTGAKLIYYRGSAVTAGYLAANRTYMFRYNGTQWELVGDINTTHSNMTAATASAAGKAGLVPAPAAGAQAKYLTGAGTFESVDDHAVTFTSGDAENPTGWADIIAVASGEKHSSLWRKFSLTVKNLRYLRKLIGNTQLSVGDGTITGAVNALNTGLSKKQNVLTTQLFSSEPVQIPAGSGRIVEVPYSIPEGYNKILFAVAVSTGNINCYAYAYNPFIKEKSMDVYIKSTATAAVTAVVMILGCFQ